MKTQGFTLIELIVVVLLISVLAISVFPKINATSDYTYISQRDQTISLLRNVQQRAMQNTQDSETCHLVRFTTDEIGLSAKNTDGSCATGLASAIGDVDDFLLVEVEDGYTVKNALGNNITSLTFNDLGQPCFDNNDPATCATSSYVIALSDEHKVCIESEGYIHVCP